MLTNSPVYCRWATRWSLLVDHLPLAVRRKLWHLAVLVRMPDDLRGYRLTAKRLINLYLNRLEAHWLRPVLRSRPTRLVIEPTNVCNLRCPYCHTGAGRFGRRPAMLQLERLRKLLDEIGGYLFEIEVFNWGESLLHPELPELIAAASACGISTRVNTNFSVAFTPGDAERLVRSGLTELFVSIDGAAQATYERYRVGGDLARVMQNCRLVAETKARLGIDSPRLTLQFLEFPFNGDDREAITALAAELDMRLFALRGAVPDRSWGYQSRWTPWFLMHSPGPCAFLWNQPVLTVDGNIAPCRGVFRSFDDITHLAAGADESGARSFREAWNHERYRTARGFYRRRTGSAADRRLVCYDCPSTIFFERWRTHRAGGGTLENFEPDMDLTANSSWNYFWERGQQSELPEPR